MDARLIIIAAVAYGLMVDPATGDGGMRCLWMFLTGHECPGCGMSRALAWLVRGNLDASMAANWLMAPTTLIAAQHAVAAVRRDAESPMEN